MDEANCIPSGESPFGAEARLKKLQAEHENLRKEYEAQGKYLTQQLARIQLIAEGDSVDAFENDSIALAAVRRLRMEQENDYKDMRKFQLKFIEADQRQPLDTLQAKLVDFHRAIDVTVGETPAARDHELRAALIAEEALETCLAILIAKYGPSEGRTKLQTLVEEVTSNLDACEYAKAMEEAIDGMCDTLYVVLGTAVAFGVQLQQFFDEVHFTNMQKATGPIRADGKRLKPEGWQPPDIAGILMRQKRRKGQ